MPGWEVRPVKGFLPARSPMHWVNPKHLLLGHNSPNTDSCCLGPPPTSSIIKEGPMDTSPTQIGCLVGKLGLFRAFFGQVALGKPEHLFFGHNSPNTENCCLGPLPTCFIIKDTHIGTSPTQIGCLAGKLGLLRAFYLSGRQCTG